MTVEVMVVVVDSGVLIVVVAWDYSAAVASADAVAENDADYSAAVAAADSAALLVVGQLVGRSWKIVHKVL